MRKFTLVLGITVTVALFLSSFFLLSFQANSNSILISGLQQNMEYSVDVFKTHRKEILKTKKSLKSHKKVIKENISEAEALAKRLNLLGWLTSDIVQKLNNDLVLLKKSLYEVTQELEDLKALVTSIDIQDYFLKKEAKDLAMYKNSLKSTVFIKVEYTYELNGETFNASPVTGSGTFIYSTDCMAYILTASHVIRERSQTRWVKDEKGEWGFKQITLTPKVKAVWYSLDSDTIRTFDAAVVANSPDNDLAVLRMEAPAPAVSEIISEREIRNLRVLDNVYVTGCPLGATPRLNKGELTAWIHAKEGYIEANTEIIYGNSGGSLFINGKVLGMTSKGRVSGSQIVETLGLFVSPTVIRDFLISNGLDIILGNS